MRVLHLGKFYPPHPGGIESYLARLCQGLRPWAEVEVLAAGTRRTRRETLDGVPVTRYATWFSVSSAPVCPGMLWGLRRARADLIHLHWPNPPAVLAYLAAGKGRPVIASYHSDIVRQRTLGKAFEPFLRRFLDHCQAIIVASANYVESSPILSQYKDRCRVIPYGIPLEPYGRQNAAAVSEIRRRFGPRIVLGVGRLVHYKGFEHLIRAMKGVEGSLLIIGEGPCLERLERESLRCGVADRVAFLGGVPDLIPYYQAADVFVLASVERSEAFGIVQLEAMACGKPVVNTRLDTGVPFVSIDGLTGLTVPPADAAALAAALRRLLDDPPLRDAYGREARLRVEREFSLERMVERTLAIYRDPLI